MYTPVHHNKLAQCCEALNVPYSQLISMQPLHLPVSSLSACTHDSQIMLHRLTAPVASASQRLPRPWKTLTQPTALHPVVATHRA